MSNATASSSRKSDKLPTPSKRVTESFYNVYNLKQHLGNGGYGMVWACEEKRRPGRLSAVKIISDSKCKRKKFCPSRGCDIPEEVAYWMPLKHPLVVSLKEFYFESSSNHWYLVTEYFHDYHDLFHFIDKNGAFSSRDASLIVNQVVEVCYYLARQGVDHRDIKDENILYNHETKTIKLIDFGSASRLTVESYRSYQGTDVYLPPEYYKHKCYDPFPASVWSIGCLAFVLINGDCPFKTKEEISQYKALTWRAAQTESNRQAFDFIEMCLEADPNRRIALGALTHHPWLNMYV